MLFSGKFLPLSEKLNMTYQKSKMRRHYEKPAIRVIVLQQQHLLMLSGEISGYRESDNGFSQDDE